MSKSIKRPIIQFDRGVEEIYHKSDVGTSLPSWASFSPSQLAFSDQIDATLSPTGMEEFLQKALLPEIERDLLKPHHFRDTLEQLATLLRNYSDAMHVPKALKVIDSNLQMLELLAFYRNALIPG